jgi:hypothetical protein
VIAPREAMMRATPECPVALVATANSLAVDAVG